LRVDNKKYIELFVENIFFEPDTGCKPQNG